MRSLSLVVLLVVALYLVSHSADGDVSFNLNNSSAATYNKFIENVRNALKSDSKPVYGIPVLRKTASGSARYLSVHLTTSNNRTITLGIDVVNAYVVAYKAGNQSYYLKDTPSDAHKFLFQDTKRNPLPFDGSYGGLAGKSQHRRDVELGLTPMGFAIQNMYNPDKKFKNVAKGLIVLIQSVSEASRFKYIQRNISEHFHNKFLPDLKFIGLENNWGSLSQRILTANNGQFESPVQIAGVNVTNVASIENDMGLLLNKTSKLVYDDIMFMPNDRDTAAVTNTATEAAAAAAAMETASYRYSYTHRKSFLNPAREAIAAM